MPAILFQMRHPKNVFGRWRVPVKFTGKSDVIFSGPKLSCALRNTPKSFRKLYGTVFVPEKFSGLLRNARLVWDYWKEDLLTMFCYFAPVIRHSVQTMCTMFSRKDFFRLFGGLLRISTRKTNAEPRCLTSLDGHDGAICAAKHLELVHAHHLANPYTDLTNSIWEKKY